MKTKHAYSSAYKTQCPIIADDKIGTQQEEKYPWMPIAEQAMKLHETALIKEMEMNRPYRLFTFTQWPRFRAKHLLTFPAQHG